MLPLPLRAVMCLASEYALGPYSMESASLVRITQEATRIEQACMKRETHPQILAAHRAALKDLADTLRLVERSTRLSDRVRITG